MLAAAGRAEVQPLPEIKVRFDDDTIGLFTLISLLIVVVGAPFTHIVIRSWSVEDVCLPLQLWSVMVVVTTMAALWVRMEGDGEWSENVAYVSVFVCLWFFSGITLFISDNCGGEDFRVAMMMLVCLCTILLLIFYLGHCFR